MRLLIFSEIECHILHENLSRGIIPLLKITENHHMSQGISLIASGWAALAFYHGLHLGLHRSGYAFEAQ
jgi:hypothetical protein